MSQLDSNILLLMPAFHYLTSNVCPFLLGIKTSHIPAKNLPCSCVCSMTTIHWKQYGHSYTLVRLTYRDQIQT
jgi:hypothetical protein